MRIRWYLSHFPNLSSFRVINLRLHQETIGPTYSLTAFGPVSPTYYSNASTINWLEQQVVLKEWENWRWLKVGAGIDLRCVVVWTFGTHLFGDVFGTDGVKNTLLGLWKRRAHERVFLSVLHGNENDLEG
ncbi:LOW QUALITY PROTEIN: hypothetical protein PanWU01x14_335690 [Parasponia andersonii]|uniref:Uncharacterized protein n=1 Tax=Parasponia andersonii TaxID=3476 RepID=A0A2P5AG27_PARAD|nr:LOW QUALITY PROTEIN: hypothetical protein PanWU01x14_335690 [Parasponia andersonii]